MTPGESLNHYIKQHDYRIDCCVAYSGGVDSHVLLVLLAAIKRQHAGMNLRAFHVDHSLQAQSASWAEHAKVICDSLDVPLDIFVCSADTGSQGPEANARKARYREFARNLKKDEHLLLAQHAEDQAETFLLQALRGSGPDGLAAIPRKRPFARGIMARPLLGCSQESILEFARENSLDWVEDPSNQQQQFDRNYLRMEIMPLLKSRWPAATQTLSRSAMRSAAASQVLLSVAQEDLNSVKVSGKPELSLAGLKDLPRERAFMAIRLWVRQRGLQMPRLQDLVQVHANLVNARHDSNGIVNVRDYEFRRHKDSLCLLMPQKPQKPFRYVWSAPYDDLFIAETGLTVTFEECIRQGLQLPSSDDVIIKSRAGGELIKLGQPGFHKAVKKVLQESSIPPWQRDSVPLVYIEERLAAVWQLAVAVDYRSNAASSSTETANKLYRAQGSDVSELSVSSETSA